jgi:predicted ATPase with chaperone activity
MSFESPDEPQVRRYAISLLDAERLLNETYGASSSVRVISALNRFCTKFAVVGAVTVVVTGFLYALAEASPTFLDKLQEYGSKFSEPLSKKIVDEIQKRQDRFDIHLAQQNLWREWRIEDAVHKPYVARHDRYEVLTSATYRSHFSAGEDQQACNACTDERLCLLFELYKTIY